jgi:uncharacterized caspase-like protein
MFKAIPVARVRGLSALPANETQALVARDTETFNGRKGTTGSLSTNRITLAIYLEHQRRNVTLFDSNKH